MEVAFSKYGRRKPDALALVGICLKDGTRVEECLFGHGGKKIVKRLVVGREGVSRRMEDGMSNIFHMGHLVLSLEDSALIK